MMNMEYQPYGRLEFHGLFCCGSLLPVFGVRVSVRFHLMFVHISFSSVLGAEWPPFGKGLSTRLTICSLCILTLCYFRGAHWPSG